MVTRRVHELRRSSRRRSTQWIHIIHKEGQFTALTSLSVCRPIVRRDSFHQTVSGPDHSRGRVRTVCVSTLISSSTLESCWTLYRSPYRQCSTSVNQHSGRRGWRIVKSEREERMVWLARETTIQRTKAKQLTVFEIDWAARIFLSFK